MPRSTPRAKKNSLKSEHFERIVKLMASFSAAFVKLLELGVPTSQFAGDRWIMSKD